MSTHTKTTTTTVKKPEDVKVGETYKTDSAGTAADVVQVEVVEIQVVEVVYRAGEEETDSEKLAKLKQLLGEIDL